MKRRHFLAGGAATGMLATGAPGLAAMGQTQQTPEERAALIARYKAERAAAVATFPFVRTTVPGEQAMATMKALRKPGVVPVIVGDQDSLEQIVDLWSMGAERPDRRTVDEIIAMADRLDHPAALRARPAEQLKAMIAAIESQPAVDHQQTENRDPFVAQMRAELAQMEANGLPTPETGDWPEDVGGDASDGPFVVCDLLTQEYLSAANILQVPTDDWTTVPAHLRMGGWNNCPDAAYHIAAFRSWRDRYGARLVSTTLDVVELHVERKPATREEALALAEEFYLYCNDTVDQGTGTLAPLAAALMVSDWWYFWWD